MNDVMALLAEANPVRAEELAPLDPPARSRRRSSRRRLVLAVAVVVPVAVIAAIGFGGSPSAPPVSVGTTGSGGSTGPAPPTIDHPLFGAASEVSLATAAAALGAPIVLPDTSSVSPSDVGAVWLNGGGVTAAVTFPKQGFWVYYAREKPTIYYDNMLRHYEAGAHQDRSEFRVVLMNGMPALVGSRGVTLVAGGTEISLSGGDSPDQSILVAAAQSIADRSESPPAGQLGEVGGVQLYPYVRPAKQVALSDLSKALGGPVVLPDTTLVKPSDAAQAWAGGTCPHPGARGHWVEDEMYACWLWISFPGTSLSVGYVRPPIYEGSIGEWKLWLSSPGSDVVELSGVPALLVPENGPFPGWLEFDVDGSRIIVGGDYDAATLQAVAQSIVDGLQAK